MFPPLITEVWIISGHFTLVRETDLKFEKMNYCKLLADYRLTCNIQILKIEWSNFSPCGKEFFRG